MKKLLMFSAAVLAASVMDFAPAEASDSKTESEKVIISFNGEIDYQFLEEAGAEVHEEFDSISAVSATFPDGLPATAADAHSSIEYIEENQVVKAAAQKASWGYPLIRANKATSLGYTGKDVKIAIIDSGINNKHPDLKIAGGISKVPERSAYSDRLGHGTHVAGIIGAQNNSIGTVGVAPDSLIYSVKVLNDYGAGDLEGVIAGVQWAIDQKMDIINMSLTTESDNQALKDVLKKAYDQGILIVAASGNYAKADEFKKNSSNVLFPARYSSVIAVGSISQLNKLSVFSYYGTAQELVAPGEGIISTFVNAKTTTQDDYQSSEGTSVATPFAAGTFAQYMEAYPHLSNGQLRATVARAALDLGTAGKDTRYGHGMVRSLATAAALFPDMKRNQWYTAPIQSVFDRGIIKGFPDGTFRPGSSITRAEAATVIGRALNWTPDTTVQRFTDVPKSLYSAGYINKAYDLGYIKGTSGTKFSPDAPIKRADLVLILQRIYAFKSTQSHTFEDVATDAYYFEAIEAAYDTGLLTGYDDNTIRPENPITRAESSKLLDAALK